MYKILNNGVLLSSRISPGFYSFADFVFWSSYEGLPLVVMVDIHHPNVFHYYFSKNLVADLRWKHVVIVIMTLLLQCNLVIGVSIGGKVLALDVKCYHYHFVEEDFEEWLFLMRSYNSFSLCFLPYIQGKGDVCTGRAHPKSSM